MSQTTSGTFSGSPSIITLLNASPLRIAQVIGAKETATGAQLANALDAPGHVKAWHASGIHVWCEEEADLFFQKNQTVCRIGAERATMRHGIRLSGVT